MNKPIPAAALGSADLADQQEKAMKQLERLEKLLTRKRGATAMEIATEVGTVAPHKRLSELKARGWCIWRKAIPGKNYGRYFGRAPA